MKKETQIHATVEIIDILPNFTFTGGTIEDVREQAKQALKAKFEGLAVDHFNISDVKVVEIENRISTEDLIKAARHCAKITGCDGCVLQAMDDCASIMKTELADRLEELHKQLTVTPIKINCSTCKYHNRIQSPCYRCDGSYSEWVERGGE